MGRLINHIEVGEEVVRSLGLTGKEATATIRMVEAYLSRFGMLIQCGVRYEGKGLIITPYMSSLKRRLMRDPFYNSKFDDLKYNLKKGNDVTSYFRMMMVGAGKSRQKSFRLKIMARNRKKY